MRTIFSCSEWGARPADTSHMGLLRPPGITCHHTAGPSPAPRKRPADEKQRCFKLARSIQAYHMDHNGWTDSGQHLLVCRGGLILEGRHGTLEALEQGKIVRGAHAGSNAGNATVGIEVEGQSSQVPPTEVQWQALGELCGWLAFVSNFDTQQILPHSHWRSTECPGSWIRNHLEELRAAAHAHKLTLMAAD